MKQLLRYFIFGIFLFVGIEGLILMKKDLVADGEIHDTPITNTPITDDPITNTPITDDPIINTPITDDPIKVDPQ